MSLIDVSVIIVNYKTPEFTCKAIETVVNSSPSVTKEIIVVDNDSQDNSVDTIRKEWGDKIVLIENHSNDGFAKANNLAMRQAQGRYYMLLNSDAEVIDDAIARLIKFADETPESGIIGCSIISPDGSRQASCWRPPTLKELFFRALGLYKLLPDGFMGMTNINQYGKPTVTKKVSVVSGCIMLINRKIADEVGLFDERFFMYSEDTEWCHRMNKHNYDVTFFADATVKHFGGGTSASMFEKMNIEQMRSILQFFHKEYNSFSIYFANFLMMLFFIIRLPVWILFFLFRSKRENARRMIKSYTQAIHWHFLWPFKEGISSLRKKVPNK